MGTTTINRLTKAVPSSETEWHGIAAEAHRSRALPGDEAAAKTHELRAFEIRANLSPGSTRAIRLCPACRVRGQNYILLFMGGRDRCGSCGWDGTA